MKKKIIIIVGIVLVVCLAFGGVMGWKLIAHERKQGKRITSLAKKQKELTAKIDNQNELIDQLQSEIDKLQESEERKNFDGVYRKLRDGEDIKVAVIGDSIGAGCGASDFEHMWATKFNYWLQYTYGIRCDYVNSSLGGNASYAGYVSINLLDPEKDYDLAILCYGQNDASEGFSYNYESLIRSLYVNNPECTIIPILESSQHSYTQKMVDICKLAEYYGLDVADTIESFNANDGGMDALLADGTHPNDAGHEVYFQTVKAVVERGVAEEKGYVEMQKIPYNGGVDGFDSFQYLAKEDFELVGDNTLEIEIEHTWAFLGINKVWTTGLNEVNVYIDDNLFVCDSTTSNLGYGMQKIYRFSAGPTEIQGKIRLEFHDQEQLDAFYGLILSKG